VPVTLGLEVVAVDEAQRRGVDAVAQAALGRGSVGENMPEVAVAVARAHFGAHHDVAVVGLFDDVVAVDRFSEAWPAGTAVELVDRGEQRLARHHVDVDARLVVVEVFAGEGSLGAALLGDLVLLGAQCVDRGRILVVVVRHRCSSW
jgi:hypothetical protein